MCARVCVYERVCMNERFYETKYTVSVTLFAPLMPENAVSQVVSCFSL